MPLKIGHLTLAHELILAPMCGITLKPFRKICKEQGADLVFNQMVSAKALTMRDKKSFHIMDFDEDERPVGLQVFGNAADTLAEASLIIQEKNPDVIDLNLGCPAKKIVNDGGGSALLNDLNELKLILKAMRKNISGIFTIKIRAGWDDSSRNCFEVLQIAEGEGVQALTLHARTRAQGYSGKSDWDLIRSLKEKAAIPIIGNGDVQSADDARRMLRETGCDGVMTGRGAFENPWIFADYRAGTTKPPTVQDSKALILKQYAHSRDYFGETGAVKMMRKHLCAYTKGWRGGAKFRGEIVRIDAFDEIQKRIDDFFTEDQAHEPGPVDPQHAFSAGDF